MKASSREAILNRVRAATRTDANRYDALPRNYIRRGSLDSEGCVRLMTERLLEYDAQVVECSTADLPAVVVRQIQLSGRHPIVVQPGIPAEWLGDGVAWRADTSLALEDIEGCGGVATAASAGIADSGTIVLHHGPEEGRRVITLLPDFHLCVIRSTQIVETLPEYFARFPQPPGLATYISGPSATADIEMTRIKGVHGPRFLSVIIVRDDL
jgi:L-lactate dehydrogenase complex protein LldG